jgi:predicted PurR-regulated permease PerM
MSLEALEPRVGKLESDMATMVSKVDSLADSVTTIRTEHNKHFERIHARLDETSRQGRVTAGAVTGIIAVCISLITLVASFVFLVTKPLNRQIESNTQQIDSRRDELKSDYQMFGAVMADVEDHSDHIRNLMSQQEALVQEVYFQKGVSSALKQQVDSIDQGGLRIWNKAQHKPAITE